jgi:hypothetical protein
MSVLLVLLGAASASGADRPPARVHDMDNQARSWSDLSGAEALRSETVGARPSPQALTTPGSFALKIDGDLSLDGNIFKNGHPFLHDDYPGARNVALGTLAMVSLTPYDPDAFSGTNNAALGTYAMRYTTTGWNNSVVGAYALNQNTVGNGNSALGTRALFLNTAGNLNTAVGVSALYSNRDGWENTAIGASALRSNGSGIFNAALGRSALVSNVTGSHNTAIGWGSLASNVTGSYNIAVGSFAGGSITGDDNISIGAPGVAGESDVTRIGSTQVAAYVAGIWGASSPGGTQVFVNGDGKLGTTLSSRRFKEEIAPMEAASTALLTLKPVSFRYTEEAAGAGPRPTEYGLIAEEVAEVLPELVIYDDDGEPYSVRYHLLTPMLLEEVQRLRREVDALEARNRAHAELFARLERLESMSGLGRASLAPDAR